MENLDEVLKCAVCSERVTPPIKVCLDEHIVCKNTCGEQLEQCPKCQDEFLAEGSVPKLLQKVLEAVPGICRFAKNGCPKIMNRTNLPNHEQVCDYKIIKCEKPQCKSEKIVYCKLNRHIKSAHSGTNEICIEIAFDVYHEITIPNLADEGKVKFWFFKEKSSGKYFTLQYYIDPNKIFYLSIQYVSKKESAKKYLYEIGYTLGQSINVSLGNYCAFYFTTISEMLRKENVVSFDLSQGFFYDTPPSALKLRFKIVKNLLFCKT